MIVTAYSSATVQSDARHHCVYVWTRRDAIRFQSAAYQLIQLMTVSMTTVSMTTVPKRLPNHDSELQMNALTTTRVGIPTVCILGTV